MDPSEPLFELALPQGQAQGDAVTAQVPVRMGGGGGGVYGSGKVAGANLSQGQGPNVMSYSNSLHTSGLVTGQYSSAGAGMYGSAGMYGGTGMYSSSGVRGNLYSTMEAPSDYHTTGVGGVSYGIAAQMQSAHSEMGWAVSRP